MRKPTVLDWLGATLIWGIASVIVGAFTTAVGHASVAIGITVGFGMFSAGVVAARIWVLRRSGELEAAEGGSPLAVLDAIDMRLMELHGVSGRLTELEERVDFSERLLAQGRAGDQEVPRA